MYNRYQPGKDEAKIGQPMRNKSDSEQPKNKIIRAKHLNHLFGIDAGNLPSKRTFTLCVSLLDDGESGFRRTVFGDDSG